ncbi:MAG: hypothetical protein AB7S38_05560 [Vulcanimicrobiota bacterium]
MEIYGQPSIGRLAPDYAAREARAAQVQIALTEGLVSLQGLGQGQLGAHRQYFGSVMGDIQTLRCPCEFPQFPASPGGPQGGYGPNPFFPQMPGAWPGGMPQGLDPMMLMMQMMQQQYDNNMMMLFMVMMQQQQQQFMQMMMMLMGQQQQQQPPCHPQPRPPHHPHPHPPVTPPVSVEPPVLPEPPTVDPEPVAPQPVDPVEPSEPPVEPSPPTEPVAPVTPSQPPREPSRTEKVDKFVAALRQAGSDVSQDQIRELAVQNGLSEQDANDLIEFLAEVDEGDIDFSDNEVIEMLGIYKKAAGADGDIRVLSDALLDYANSDVVTDSLSESCYNALVRIAGNPPEAGTLTRRLTEIDGWDWGGIDLHDDAMRNTLRAFKDAPPTSETPAAPPASEAPEQARQRKMSDFMGKLRRAGNDVSQDRVRELAVESGLTEADANNLIDFLSEVDGGDIDFTDNEVLEMTRIFEKAANANGDVKVLASALLDYANSDVVTDSLSEECYDALVRAAGNPPEAGTLTRRLLDVDGWDWGGMDLHDDSMRNILQAWQ